MRQSILEMSISDECLVFQIPGFISHHYRRPPSLAPSLQEAIQLEAVSHNRNTMGSSREDKEQFLQSLLALESQLLLLSYENKTSPLSVSAPLPIPPDDIKSTDQTKHKPKEKSSASNSLLPEVMEMVLSSSTPGQEMVLSSSTPGQEMVLSSSTPGQEMVLSSSTPGQETEDKLDSYFRFGEDFVTPAVPVSNHHETETLTNFKIDDINPNNFKHETETLTNFKLDDINPNNFKDVLPRCKEYDLKWWTQKTSFSTDKIIKKVSICTVWKSVAEIQRDSKENKGTDIHVSLLK
ncbi:hypothetical protein M8J77_004450 [Diaphorina citri]|nr:hypothetical protein M8J77_004450 [Diaphorina citri]